MTRLFFGSFPFPSASTTIGPSMWSPRAKSSERQGVLHTVDCDHYRAIPLSDGVHVLFTDPNSGLLCLGSDAPLGGPTKLIRKFVFLPPGYISTTTKLLPTCYAAAQELQWGVRVFVAYVDGSLILFNIPSDCFNHVKQISNTPDIWDEQAGVVAQSDLLMDVMMDLQRTSEEATRDNPEAEMHSQTHTHARPLRTIQVPGVRITNLEGRVDDIAVLCQEGGLHVWTFHSNGRAKCWDLLRRPHDHINIRRVTNPGHIEDASKAKAKVAAKGTHVHFGGIDGSGDAENRKLSIAMESERIAASFMGNIEHHHRALSMGGTPHTFEEDFPREDDLMCCLAYRRMVFERMGSQRSSVSTISEVRRKSDI